MIENKLNEFLEIAPATRELAYGGKQFWFTAIPMRQWAFLFDKYPALVALFDAEQREKLMSEITNQAPECVTSIIAVSAGFAGNKKVEERIAALGAGENILTVLDIIELSFPGGFVDFFQMVTEKMGSRVARTEGDEEIRPTHSEVPDDDIPERAQRIFGGSLRVQ